MKAMVPQLLDLPAILIPATQLLMLAELLMMAMVHQKMALEMLTLDSQSLMWKQLPEMLKGNIPLHLNMRIQAEMMNTLLLLTVTTLHQQKMHWQRLPLEMLTQHMQLQKVLQLTVIMLHLVLMQPGQLRMSMVLQESMKETFRLQMWKDNQEMAQQLHQPGLMGLNCVQEGL